MNVLKQNHSIPSTNKIIINKKECYISVDDIPLSAQALTALMVSKKTKFLLWIAHDIHEMDKLHETINTFNTDNTSIYSLKPF